MYLRNRKRILLAALIILFLIPSCYKKDIQFGNDLGETYTQLIDVDTIGISTSTVLIDSFATNSSASFLFGQYRDSAFGTITAKPHFQLSLPSDISLAEDAVYDSLTLILKLNKYYYGDTTKTQTLVVNELAAPIEYTYNNQLFNTSKIAEKPEPLGSKLLKISPSNGDSLVVRLNDAKGSELFGKLKGKSNEVLSADAFLNYFKGVSIGFSESDFTGIYGLGTSADSIHMRMHYHVSVPYPQELYKDFAFSEAVYFNQILADRSGTLLQTNGTTGTGWREILSSQTDNEAFSQTGTGTLLKFTFPSLKDVLKVGSIVKLLKATLVIRPAQATYDLYRLKLPPYLYLATTNGSNVVGSAVTDSTSGSVLYSQPTIDNIYNTGTNYQFDITTNINTLLSTAGTDGGFYLLEGSPGSAAAVNRMVLNNSENAALNSQLILSVLTVKN